MRNTKSIWSCWRQAASRDITDFIKWVRVYSLVDAVPTLSPSPSTKAQLAECAARSLFSSSNRALPANASSASHVQVQTLYSRAQHSHAASPAADRQSRTAALPPEAQHLAQQTADHLHTLVPQLAHHLTLAYERVTLPCSAMNCGDIIHKRCAGCFAPGVLFAAVLRTCRVGHMSRQGRPLHA